MPPDQRRPDVPESRASDTIKLGARLTPILLASLMLMAPPTSVRADENIMALGPSFDCRQAHDPLALLICGSAPLSRTDLQFVQAYQALRQQVGPDGQNSLRQEAVDFHSKILLTCGLPRAGAFTPTPTTVRCVQQAYENQRATWLARLTPPASEEAKRSVERHVALQHDLQSLGFLSETEKIDGVYGTNTRVAIAQWQQSIGRPPTGVLGDTDAEDLERRMANGPAGKPTAPWTNPTSNSPQTDVVLVRSPVTEASNPKDDMSPEQQGEICKTSSRNLRHALVSGLGLYTFTVAADWTYHPFSQSGPSYTVFCKLNVRIDDTSDHPVFSNTFAWGFEDASYEADVFLHTMPDGTILLVANQTTGGSSDYTTVRVFSFSTAGARPALLVASVEGARNLKFHGSDLDVSGIFDEGQTLCNACDRPIRTASYKFDKDTRHFVAVGDNVDGLYLADLAAGAYDIDPWTAYTAPSPGDVHQHDPWQTSSPDFRVDVRSDDLLRRLHSDMRSTVVDRAAHMDIAMLARIEAWANIHYTCNDWKKASEARNYNPIAKLQNFYIQRWIVHFPPIATRENILSQYSQDSSASQAAAYKDAAIDLVRSVARRCDTLNSIDSGGFSLADIVWLAWTTP